MSSPQGWIRLDRAIFNWQWYTEQNVKSVFLHALLRANHSPTKWRGISIKRGQFFTSLDSLAHETGLSKQKIRTALKKLESTGELTSKPQAAGRMITVIKYEQYQDINSQPNRQATGKQQAANRGATPNNHDNHDNHDNHNNNTPPKGGLGGEGDLFDKVDTPPAKPKTPPKKQAKQFVPPSKEEFVAYVVEKLPTKNPEWSVDQATRGADHQFEIYVAQDWHDGHGKKVADWKNKAMNAMIHKKPWNYGSNQQSFADQRADASNPFSPNYQRSCG